MGKFGNVDVLTSPGLIGTSVSSVENQTEIFITVNPVDAQLTDEYVNGLYEICLKNSNTLFSISIAWADEKTIVFDVGQLEGYRLCIQALLGKVQKVFKNHPGGNMHWAAELSPGDKWTNNPLSTEHLFLLGRGIGAVEFFPSSEPVSWSIFDNKKPYVYLV